MKTYHQQKIIFFSLKNNFASAFIYGNKAILVTDLNERSPEFMFSVQPALQLHKVDDLIIKPANSNYKTSNFIMQDDQIQFYDYKILILSKKFNHKIFQGYPQFSAILIHDDPIIDLENIKTSFNADILLADATNKAYNLKKYSIAAKKSAYILKILRKNPAYLIDLNK
ncbi:MAG: hypothetical protein EOP53_25385 [Sphingobacteriales bacterium]|nr:MAG: hypothetical protein EOP53_25385 [Sphingobacteriales bacterium]